MSRHGENIRKRKDGRWEARYVKGRDPRGKALYASVYTTFICLFYGISRYKKRPSYHDWQLGLKLYDMEYMGINFGKEIQTETKALKVKN